MKAFSKRSITATLGVALALCAGLTQAVVGQSKAAVAGAQRQVRFTPRRAKDAARHSNDAARVLRQVMSVPERAIPRELLEGAEAVAVCPGVLSAAFIVGGRKGDCVISRRTPKKSWGAPVFYNMTGGSFGAQIGGTKTDFVLLFMNDAALKGMLEDKFEIGGEVGIAAGPGTLARRGNQPDARRRHPLLRAQQGSFHRRGAQGRGDHHRQQSQRSLLRQEGHGVAYEPRRHARAYGGPRVPFADQPLLVASP